MMPEIDFLSTLSPRYSLLLLLCSLCGRVKPQQLLRRASERGGKVFIGHIFGMRDKKFSDFFKRRNFLIFRLQKFPSMCQILHNFSLFY